MTAYAEKTARLLAAVESARRSGQPGVGLAKTTSNLFRERAPRRAPRIDVSHFNGVLRVDASANRVEAEGMTTFAALADATLAAGAMPAFAGPASSVSPIDLS